MDEMEHGLSQKAVEIARPLGFPITNSMVVMWIVAVGLILFAQTATRTMKQVPDGPQNLLEWIIQALYRFLEIVTPDAVVYSADVHMVTLPAIDGQIGIFPRHVPVLTRIVPGEVIVRKNGDGEFLAIGEGLVEITGDRVAIVTDMAVAAKDIDEARAVEARQRAAARLRDKISDEEVATVNASLARSLAQLRVKRRYRGARS